MRSEESILTTVIGLDDVIVVSTADAVLVGRARQGGAGEGAGRGAQEAKPARGGRAPPHTPGRGATTRTWTSAQRYRVKRIVVKPGNKLSLQKHFHRSEHWVVVHGTAEVTLGSDMRSVHENESIYIPIGSVHRLANPGKIPLELIEVQVGSYLGEDDIVRLDDVYGGRG